VRYRASQTDDRRMKSWVTGSVGAAPSALDAMQLHMLTERCLITQGANNFMLMNLELCIFKRLGVIPQPLYFY